MQHCTIVPILIVVILLIIYSNDYIPLEAFTRRHSVCNEIDGRCYPIVDSFDQTTHAEASKMLAYLNMFSIKLMRHLRHKYLWEKQGTKYRRAMVAFLLENYNPDSIIENNPSSDVNTSYVEDKGRIFAICLREKESGMSRIHTKQILEFVVMHEMSHMSTQEIGHEDPEFWINFKILIEEAVALGMHEPIDYAKYPISYCSLKVDYNPYFDPSIQSL